MSNMIYLKLTGKKQGLISSGCSNMNSTGKRFHLSHDNEICVYKLINTLSRDDYDPFRHVDIIKPIDKSTPLLANALNEKERLTCEFFFFRTVEYGRKELYFKFILQNAFLTDIRFIYPNSFLNIDCNPHESISFAYSSAIFEHVKGQTRSLLTGNESVQQSDYI
ncbi:type VI secretion system tube protein TssD [Lonsdalea quercina]|uniref:type VI secretion system tube protein TssD n=1 Tax=Lonsdalea quercina TaxID=71657 RepID=UPI0039770553